MNWDNVINHKYQSTPLPLFSFEKPSNTPSPHQLLQAMDPCVDFSKLHKQKQPQQIYQEVPAPQILGHAEEPKRSLAFRIRKGFQVFSLSTIISLGLIAVFFLWVGNPTIFTTIGSSIYEGFMKFMTIFS